MSLKPTKLLLESGEVFYGLSPAWQKPMNHGEVVFTTGMTGYVETLTDPSYADQMIVFTYPLIGNYGVTEESTWESKKIHAAGVIISEQSPFFSHSKAQYSFLEWLKQQEIPLITGIDTRTLTMKIRKKGVTPGVICDSHLTPCEFIDPNISDLVAKVSIKEPELLGLDCDLGRSSKTIIVVDCGIKESILKNLLKFGVKLKRVPFDYDYTQEPFDGLFISNGPGDPSNCIKTIAYLQKALKAKKPVFGICLGAQLLALAIGAKTYKLVFGHRAQNQPTFHYETQKCYLTSQNHGYAIDEHSLPKEWVVSFRHLNDQSVQGIAHKKDPFFAVQFHPEATPGPVDTDWLFEKFITLVDHA